MLSLCLIGVNTYDLTPVNDAIRACAKDKGVSDAAAEKMVDIVTKFVNDFKEGKSASAPRIQCCTVILVLLVSRARLAIESWRCIFPGDDQKTLQENVKKESEVVLKDDGHEGIFTDVGTCITLKLTPKAQ